MRISGLGTLTMGMLLLNGADARAEDATLHVARALNIACGPWMAGGDATALAAKLREQGWDSFDEALYAKAGPWGTVAIALEQTNGSRRGCRLHMRTNEEPWTTIAATTAAQAWISSKFPAAEIHRSMNAIINGKAARTAHWQCGATRISLTTFKTKQTAPESDFLLEIETA